jgi:peptidoglycan/LPS O-acetylase OafA/YrhL
LGHVPALDGLRGVAVAGVLLFHGDHLAGGFLGVDLFFVLSGFLITSLLLREWAGTGGIALLAFWRRRGRRLLPALFGLLGGVAIYVLVWARPVDLDAIRASALATVLYVANWQAIWAGHGYWDLYRAPSPLQHTWSLAIEEQFYLVWPVLVAVVLGRRRRRGRPGPPAILTVALGLAAVSTAWMMWRVVPGEDPSRVYYGTDTRAASVLLGAALAAWLSWRGTAATRRGRLALEGLAVLGALWLVYAWATIDGQSTFLYRGGFLLCELAVVAVIAGCVQPHRGPIATALAVAPLRWLGLISYGLYLWHWPVFLVLQIEHSSLGLSDWSLFAAQVALSLLLAIVSFFVLEEPIRLRGLAAWGRPGRFVMPAAAALTVVLAVVVTAGGVTLPEFTYASSAGSGADDPSAATLGTLPEVLDVGPTTAPAPGGTTPRIGSAGAGVVTDPIARPAGRHPRLLVVGDSVAY